jgi:signal-transduction protein with cAMP-binding, CBS, and nucleotidyltransferase domain
VLSGLPPLLTVTAVEDTLCYLFPDPRPHLRHPNRLPFSHYGSLVSRERLARSGLVDQALRLARHQMRPVVWCDSSATVADAAAAMTNAGQSCALIPHSQHVGIVTDSDFRTALAAGTFSATTPAATLASFPAETIGADTLVGDAFLKMVESGYHHLVVTGAAEKPVRPPVGFVRDFVVEHSGDHRGHLDLKAGGLVPIASLGRWIAIVTGDDRGSTITRLRRGQAAGLLTTDEAGTLVRAFEYIYELLLDNEIHAFRTGAPKASTWIAPKELGTLTRRCLREAFRAVAEVQNRLNSEWVTRL